MHYKNNPSLSYKIQLECRDIKYKKWFYKILHSYQLINVYIEQSAAAAADGYDIIICNAALQTSRVAD